MHQVNVGFAPGGHFLLFEVPITADRPPHSPHAQAGPGPGDRDAPLQPAAEVVLSAAGVPLAHGRVAEVWAAPDRLRVAVVVDKALPRCRPAAGEAGFRIRGPPTRQGCLEQAVF